MTWKVGLGNHHATYTVYDDEGRYVMSCQDEQRAQLIASAPVMLEALEVIYAKADYMLTTPTSAIDDFVHLAAIKAVALTAIAAVKGDDNEKA